MEVKTEDPGCFCCMCCPGSKKTPKDPQDQDEPVTTQPESGNTPSDATEHTPLITGNTGLYGTSDQQNTTKDDKTSVSSLPEAIQGQGGSSPVSEESKRPSQFPKPSRPDLHSSDKDPSIDLDPPATATSPDAPDPKSSDSAKEAASSTSMDDKKPGSGGEGSADPNQSPTPKSSETAKTDANISAQEKPPTPVDAPTTTIATTAKEDEKKPGDTDTSKPETKEEAT